MVNITTPLSIIGASLTRSGSIALTASLERLGYKVFSTSKDMLRGDDKWIRLFSDFIISEEEDDQNVPAVDDEGIPTVPRRSEALTAILHELSADGYEAVVDVPFAYLYEDLMERYPEAKVVTTDEYNGSSEDEWVEQMTESRNVVDGLLSSEPVRWLPAVRRMLILKPWLRKQLPALLEHADGPQPTLPPPPPLLPPSRDRNGSAGSGIGASTRIASSVDARRYDDRDATARSSWREYHARVRQTVPADRLVVFSADERGCWETLCRHATRDDNNGHHQSCSVLRDYLPHGNKNGKAKRKAMRLLLVAVLRTIVWLWRLLWSAATISIVFLFHRVCSENLAVKKSV